MELYKRLRVKPDASSEDIRKAYRKLAKNCHPDRNPGDAIAEENFRLLQAAYEVLSDPETRLAYNRGFASIRSPSDHLLRHASGKKAMERLLPTAKKSPQCGDDLLLKVGLDRSRGSPRISFDPPPGSAKIGFRVEMELPSSIKTYRWLRMKGFGTAGRNNAEDGDLFVFLQEET